MFFCQSVRSISCIPHSITYTSSIFVLLLFVRLQHSIPNPYVTHICVSFCLQFFKYLKFFGIKVLQVLLREDFIESFEERLCLFLHSPGQPPLSYQPANNNAEAEIKWKQHYASSFLLTHIWRINTWHVKNSTLQVFYSLMNI